MVEIKSFGKRKGGVGSGAAGVSAGGSIGESVVREALHAAKADIALQAQKAAEAARAAVADYADGAGHAGTADKATDADHAASAHELDWDSPTRREFLSRKKEDSAEKCINFIKGLTVGTDGGHGMNADGDVTARDVTGRKVEADRGSFGDILMRYLSSSGFSSGLIGSGVGIWQDKAGKWHLDIDAITARQSLTVLELLIQRIRAVGGAVVLSQASGKVAEVVETGTGIGSDSYYRLYLEEGGDGDFMAGDLVRCSRWDGDSGDPERMHAYWEEAVKAEWDAARERRFVAIRRPTSTGTVPAAGDELVLMGNTRDKTRQGFIHLTVEAGKPRIAEWAGVDSAVLKLEQMVTCLGDLTGIEWQGRRLTGYGLMTRNFYGTGEIVLSTGKTAEEAFSELGDRVSAMRQGVRNLVLNSGAWTPDRQITITPGQAPGATMPAHWSPLNDGCAAAVADGLLVLRKDTATMPDGTAAKRNGLHAGVSRDPIPKGTVLTVRVKGEAGNIAGGKSIQVTLYNTQPKWTHSVVMARVTAADLAGDGSFSIEKSVTLAEEYSVPRLCVSLHDANEGAFIKLESVGLYAGTRAPELWTPAPEDAEERQAEATEAAKAAADNAQKAADAAKQDAVTYREETRTLFSVTDGLIRSEVAKTREYADTAGRNLLMSESYVGTDGKMHARTTASGAVSYYTPVTTETRALSHPLIAGQSYTFSLESWAQVMGGAPGLSLTLRGCNGGSVIATAMLPLVAPGRNLVVLEVPDNVPQTDLDAAELDIAPISRPSVVTFSRFQLVAGAYDTAAMPAWSEAPQDTAMLRGMLREETATMIEQTNDKITLSATETKKELRDELAPQVSELRSEIAVGTRLISLSVGEKAIPLGTPPYYNLLRHTNQGVTGWTAANSTEGAGAFLIQRQAWANGADFVKLRRQGAAPSDSSGWEWMRFDGLAPKALKPGTYRLQFHMLAYAQGTFGLTFLLQDTTATGDNTADNLCSAASVPVPVSQMADYSHPDLGPVKKIQKDFDVTLNVTRQGSLDVGNLRIGTTGRANILVLVIGNLRLTKGEEFREWTPSTDDYADGLRRTGIDIAQRKITLTSDTVEVKNNIGETTALLDKDGMLRTNMIRAKELNVGQVTAGNEDGQRVEVNPESMDIGIFNGKGEQVVAFDGKNYNTVADMLGTGTTETPVDITPMPLQLKGGGSPGATYPKYDKGHKEGTLLAEPFKTDHPCRLTVGGIVSANGNMPGGDSSRPNYTYCKGRMWLVSYSDQGCKNPINATELARAANRMVPWGEIVKDGPSATNTASKAPGTVMVPAGWHMIYGEASTQTCDYGKATVIVRVSSLKVSYDYYIGRFFGNGFCIGKASDYLMANFTEKGINFCIRTGDAGFKVDKDGAKVWDGYTWKGIKTD